MLKVVVRMSEWLRGEGSKSSYLYRSTDGKMCCLGFACEAAGVPRKMITDRTSPCDVYTLKQEPPAYPDALAGLLHTDQYSAYNIHSSAGGRMMTVNDERGNTDSWRMGELTMLGKQAGIEFEFVP